MFLTPQQRYQRYMAVCELLGHSVMSFALWHWYAMRFGL
jgi:hypothetical protein